MRGRPIRKRPSRGDPMKRTAVILKWTLLGLCVIALGTFTIPGVPLWFFRRERYPRWIGSAIALSIVVLFRFLNGGWNFTIGGRTAGPWWLEVMEGAVSWAIGALLVSLGYSIARYLMRGSRNGEVVETASGS